MAKIPKVKICGIHSSKEAASSLKLGADFLGLLVNIPRTNLSLTYDEAKKIILDNTRARFIILTIEQKPSVLLKMIKIINPWGIQVLRPSLFTLEKLYKKTPTKIIPVIHVIDSSSIEDAKLLSRYADYILLDSKVDKFLGGTGKTHNWAISKTIIEQCKKPVFIAGGLNQKNVVACIEETKPFAVDVESQLRDEKGFGDLIKVSEFIQVVRKR